MIGSFLLCGGEVLYHVCKDVADWGVRSGGGSVSDFVEEVVVELSVDVADGDDVRKQKRYIGLGDDLGQF